MTPEQFKAWRKRLDLTQQGAADAIGISRRMVQAYEADKQPIPKPVALACTALALGLKDYPEDAQ